MPTHGLDDDIDIYPAVNPGPNPTVSGAIERFVPRFFLAKIASTTTSGFNAVILAPSGSTINGTFPVSITFLPLQYL